jgi:hypothetical protein
MALQVRVAADQIQRPPVHHQAVVLHHLLQLQLLTALVAVNAHQLTQLFLQRPQLPDLLSVIHVIIVIVIIMVIEVNTALLHAELLFLFPFNYGGNQEQMVLDLLLDVLEVGLVDEQQLRLAAHHAGPERQRQRAVDALAGQQPHVRQHAVAEPNSCHTALVHSLL